MITQLRDGDPAAWAVALWWAIGGTLWWVNRKANLRWRRRRPRMVTMWQWITFADRRRSARQIHLEDFGLAPDNVDADE